MSESLVSLTSESLAGVMVVMQPSQVHWMSTTAAKVVCVTVYFTITNELARPTILDWLPKKSTMRCVAKLGLLLCPTAATVGPTQGLIITRWLDTN